MTLNPAFTSSTSRRLPFACGYVLGAGDQVLSTIAQDGTQYALYILGEGEWDGPAMVNTFADSGGGLPSHILNLAPSVNRGISDAQAEVPSIVHFHSGAYSPKGLALAAASNGPDQRYDAWFAQFPTVTPPQCYSGMAYAVWAAPASTGFHRGTWQPQQISGTAVWRSTRCRIFDAYGNVVSYSFTCNPAWHMVEALLRFKIRPQRPALEGLTAAEKACFHWDSILTLAARNDYLLPNGYPRFTGNYIFAADATLANMMETMLRVCRAYHRIDGGKISLIGDDARSSVFLMSANHLVPGTLHLSKKDVSKAGNVFVPRYRDLQVPAVSQVASVSTAAGGSGTVRTFTLFGPSPFLNYGFFVYGGSSDPTFNGDYDAGGAGAGSGNVQTASGPTTLTGTGAAAGGYLGSQDARFSDRAPTGVVHRAHQRMVAQQAPGLAVQPRVTNVEYDCGNSTFDQTNRLMKFERGRSLGADVAGWKAPVVGTLSGFPECVDTSGRRLSDVKVHDVISLDSWLTPEFAGDYVVEQIGITTPDDQLSLGEIALTLRAYSEIVDGYTDVSDAPGNSYTSVPNADLELTGVAPVANAAWVLQATPAVSGSGPLSIAIPDLSIQVMGIYGPTAYPGFNVSGVPAGTSVALWVYDPSGTGVSPTYGFTAGTSFSGSPGYLLVMIGVFS